MTYLGDYDFVVVAIVEDADAFVSAFENDAPESILASASAADEETIEFYVAASDEAEAYETFEEACDAISWQATVDRVETANEYAGI